MSDTNTYKEELKKLIRTHDVDAEIYDLRSRKEEFPAKLQAIEESLEAKKEGMNNADQEFKQLQIDKNEKENDIGIIEEKIKKHETDLYQLKNNNEYKKMQDEIAGLKADISLIEENIINLYDDIEAAQKKVEQEKTLFEEESALSEKEKKALREEEAAIDARLAELISERERLVGEVDPELVKSYERILKGRGRTALAPISGEFCGECNLHMRPQIINEVKKMTGPVYCESCGRILYEEEQL